MCLIAYQPIGDSSFDKSVLRNGWESNPHGAGYMFAVDGKLHIRKAFYTLKGLRAAYNADHKAYGVQSAFVLHFRWATHGGRGESNVHPHALADGAVGLVHNGVLSAFDFGDKLDSDTAMFCKTVLACRSTDNLMSAEVGQLISDMIGFTNKMVLMSADGRVVLINDSMGEWDGGRWYSNESYLPAKKQGWWKTIGPAALALPAVASGRVERGIVLASAEDRQWVPGRHQSLFDEETATSTSHWSSYDDEIEFLQEEYLHAKQSGDEHTADDIAADIMDLENERRQWAEYAMS